MAGRVFPLFSGPFATSGIRDPASPTDPSVVYSTFVPISDYLPLSDYLLSFTGLDGVTILNELDTAYQWFNAVPAPPAFLSLGWQLYNADTSLYATDQPGNNLVGTNQCTLTGFGLPSGVLPGDLLLRWGIRSGHGLGICTVDRFNIYDDRDGLGCPSCNFIYAEPVASLITGSSPGVLTASTTMGNRCTMAVPGTIVSVRVWGFDSLGSHQVGIWVNEALAYSFTTHDEVYAAPNDFAIPGIPCQAGDIVQYGILIPGGTPISIGSGGQTVSACHLVVTGVATPGNAGLANLPSPYPCSFLAEGETLTYPDLYWGTTPPPPGTGARGQIDFWINLCYTGPCGACQAIWTGSGSYSTTPVLSTRPVTVDVLTVPPQPPNAILLVAVGNTINHGFNDSLPTTFPAVLPDAVLVTSGGNVDLTILGGSGGGLPEIGYPPGMGIFWSSRPTDSALLALGGTIQLTFNIYHDPYDPAQSVSGAMAAEVITGGSSLGDIGFGEPFGPGDVDGTTNPQRFGVLTQCNQTLIVMAGCVTTSNVTEATVANRGLWADDVSSIGPGYSDGLENTVAVIGHSTQPLLGRSVWALHCIGTVSLVMTGGSQTLACEACAALRRHANQAHILG